MVRCPGAVQFFNRGRDERIKFSGTAGTGFAFFSHLFAPKRIYNFWNSAIKWPVGQVMAISTQLSITGRTDAHRSQVLPHLEITKPKQSMRWCKVNSLESLTDEQKSSMKSSLGNDSKFDPVDVNQVVNFEILLRTRFREPTTSKLVVW